MNHSVVNERVFIRSWMGTVLKVQMEENKKNLDLLERCRRTSILMFNDDIKL